MELSPQEIVELYEQLSRQRGSAVGRMMETARLYNGEVLVPLPELDEAEKPAVANLITQGIDGLARRTSSRMPDVAFPSIKPGNDREDDRAARARKALLAWWDMNKYQRRFARRARFLIAYACAPVQIKPVGPGVNAKRKMPYWHVLNPLHVLPVPTGDPDEYEISAGIVVRQQSLAWLKARYPTQAATLYKGPDARPDTMFDLLEYNDAEQTVLVVKGAKRNPNDYADFEYGSSNVEELERDPNLVGRCNIIVPGRITLDKLMGHFDNLFGMFLGQAKMTAYEQIATFRHIFPEKWVMSHPNQPQEARIVVAADAKQGIIGEIAGGVIQAIPIQVSPTVGTSIDRLERSMRVEAGIPSDWGGESASNIRTAKRGEQVSGQAVDPVVSELQLVFQDSMELEDGLAIDTAKAYWGNKSFSFYTSRKGEVAREDYRPNEVFKSDYHTVKFSMPGVDAAGIPIELGQRTSTGEMSMFTARQIDPMIEDPEFETRQVELEQIRQGILDGVKQGLASGQLDLHEAAIIAQLLFDSQTPLEDAVLEAQKRIQTTQATAAQAPSGAPETMPGMGAGPPQAGASQQPPSLAQMLTQLRTPTQQSPAERQLAGAPGA